MFAAPRGGSQCPSGGRADTDARSDPGDGRRMTTSPQGRHPRDDLVECAVRERAQFFIGPILDRVGHPNHRRLVTERLALDLGSLNESRRRDDHCRDTTTFEIA